MGFMFCDLHVSLNNPSSGDINSSNLPCLFCFCLVCGLAPQSTAMVMSSGQLI